MASVNDPAGHQDKFERERRKLRDHPHDGDADALAQWTRTLDGDYSTRYWKLNKTRRLSEAALVAGFPALTEMESEHDVYDLLERFEDGSHPHVKDDGIRDGTIRKYRQAVRLFFRDGLGREWAENVHVGAAPKNRVTRDDVLEADEVDALMAAAERTRDKAIIATLLATGQRITALLSLRVQDVELDGTDGTIHLNDDALGLKDSSGPRPLLWATPYVKNWLEEHPRRHDPDGALFCTLRSGSGNTRSGETFTWEKGEALSRQQVHRRLKTIAEATADRDDLTTVDPGNVNPHAFRHTAITRMVEDGVAEGRIKWLVGWDPDSRELGRYNHAENKSMMRGLREHYDIEPEEPVGKPTLDACPNPNCRAPLGSFFNPAACPGCGLSLAHDAAATEAVADVHDEATEEAVEATDPQLVAALQGVREGTADPETVAAAITDALRADDD